jgi:hypothetical protein
MGVLGIGPLFALTKEENLFLWSGVLVTVLLLGAYVISRLDRWRKRQMEGEDESPGHVMSFREMYERGELSKDEYDRVLRRVGERVGLKPKPAAVPPAASPQEPAAGPPATTEEPPTPPPG